MGTPGFTGTSTTVPVTVSVSNPALVNGAVNGAVAYNAIVSFTLPTGQLMAEAGSYQAGTCPAATPTLSGTTASFLFASIPLGTNCTFTFSVQPTYSATPNLTDVGTSLATWESVAATSTASESVYATDATPRTGNPSDPGGALNDYKQTGFDLSIHVPASYFQGGIGSSGGCSAAGGADLAWLGALFGLLALGRRRRALPREG
jgi:uncharacterized protein (TIGR03382 family)